MCGRISRGIYDRKLRWVRDLSCGDARIYLELEIRRVRCRGCGKVKQERFSWLADNPFYTKRFAFFVGRRCRTSTIRDVAREVNKVSLGFVEGLNNKIRVIQRRAYGLRDEEYLRLKILTCMLPQI